MKLVEKIALGTVQFGLNYGISNVNGQTEEKEVVDILNVAYHHGLSLLDTAQAYGVSEEVIGRFHNKRFDIITKIHPATNSKPVTELVKESLKRLNINTLYGVLFHSAESSLNNPGAFQELCRLKADGYVKKVGFSVYKPEELECLIEKVGVPDLVQVPFSHLDRRFEVLLKNLHGKGVEVHTRSTFLQGLFFMKPYELTAFFSSVNGYLGNLRNIFINDSQLAGGLLSYVASRPFIDKVVLGVNNSRQLILNIKSLDDGIQLENIDAPKISENILLPYLWK